MPSVLPNRTLGHDPKSENEALIKHTLVETFLGYDVIGREVRVVTHRHVQMEEIAFMNQIFFVEVIGFQSVHRLVRVRAAVEACSRRRHTGKQHLEKTFRHKHDFVANSNADC
jgi:hypothetical protein